jgi:pimeloyl-ACP methyl ester carboxylesterase
METTTKRLEPRLTGYADVNGLHMYYELYGEGSPLVLLHGGMLTIDLNFGTLIPALSGTHQLIGVEMQGHGRTADIDREITPAALAGDVAGLLDHLGIDRAHIFGHSMGGARLPAWRGIWVSDHQVRRCWCQARGS